MTLNPLHQNNVMKCIECDSMACKQFFVKHDLWTGYCNNKDSPKYGSVVTGSDNCTITQELSLFD